MSARPTDGDAATLGRPVHRRADTIERPRGGVPAAAVDCRADPPERPRGRDLAEAELRALVRALARRPDLWRALVRPDPEQRTYAQLLRDEHVAVWVICWADESDTGFHDHDLSAGAVAVVAGAVREERLVLGGGTTSRTYAAGDVFAFGAADIHRVRHAGSEPAITLHAYSPPLWRMGAYEIAAGGELRRHSLSYAEELRPLSQ